VRKRFNRRAQRSNASDYCEILFCVFHWKSLKKSVNDTKSDKVAPQRFNNLNACQKMGEAPDLCCINFFLLVVRHSLRSRVPHYLA
jgi:hypothetical protein